MRSANRLSGAALALIGVACVAAGCGDDSDGGGGGGGAGFEGSLSTGIRGMVAPVQNTPPIDPDGAPFPGMANVWDIDSGFGLNDGFDDQFDGALALSVNGQPFPSDQSYGEVTWSTPFLRSGDGVVPAIVSGSAFAAPIAGTQTAYFNAFPLVRLQQTITVGGATQTATLRWTTDGGTQSGAISGQASFFSVVIRSAATGVPLTPDISAQSAGFVLSGATLTGQPVVISFESQALAGSPRRLDAVSCTNTAGQELVVNGGFETGTLAGWTTSSGDADAVQNMRAGVRTVGGMRVIRNFFTEPSRLWGRWVDVFESVTTTAVTVTAVYTTDLGSDGAGIIAFAPNTLQSALSSWDGDGDTRDLGILFGTPLSVTFTSDTALGGFNGSDQVQSTYRFTVPGLGRATVLQYIVMNGIDTSQRPGGVTLTSRAEEVDAELKRIFDGLRSNPEFTRGMTTEQVQTIVNH